MPVSCLSIFVDVTSIMGHFKPNYILRMKDTQILATRVSYLRITFLPSS